MTNDPNNRTAAPEQPTQAVRAYIRGWAYPVVDRRTGEWYDLIVGRVFLRDWPSWGLR